MGFHHQAHILLLKDTCFVVPRVSCLFPLRWSPEKGVFSPASEEEIDALMRIVSNLNNKCSTQTATVNSDRLGLARVIFCEALYGVLQLSIDTYALLFVKACTSVGVFRLSDEAHEVKTVKAMDWIRLPRLFRNVNGQDTEEKPSVSTAALRRGTRRESYGGGTFRGRDTVADSCDEFFESINKDYFSILNAFCREVGKCSCFYFCSTLNLAYNPVDLLALSSLALDKGMKEDDRVLNRFKSIQSFQWNSMLLTSFSLPHSLSCSSCSTPPSENCNCPARSAGLARLVYLQSNEESGNLLRKQACGDECISFPQDKLLHGCLSLYVPSFIRGFVGFESKKVGTDNIVSGVITRLCCRWAGTRFNRRGLAPDYSGVCANMAISTVWIINGPNEDGEVKVAVHDLLRGSIPRQWDQQANLALKPPYHLLTSSKEALEEVCCHIDLLRHLLPNVDCLVCVDTTAKGRGERPLSESYQDSVRQYQDKYKRCHSAVVAPEDIDDYAFVSLPSIVYLNFCVGTLVLKRFKPFMTVRNRLFDLVEAACDEQYVQANEKSEMWLDFMQWSTVKNSNTVKHELQSKKEGLFHTELSRVQSTYFRINCVDCLDRSTIIQACVASKMVPLMLHSVLTSTENSTNDGPLSKEEENVVKLVLSFVREQGHNIAFLYSDTTHHLPDYPIRGILWPHDPVKMFFIMWMRWYQQNFFDGRKQDGVSLVTLQHHPLRSSCSVDSGLSKDMSTINRHVFLGILCAVLPSLYSILAFILAEESRKYHGAFAFIWGTFLFYIFVKLREVSETLTSRPILRFDN